MLKKIFFIVVLFFQLTIFCSAGFSQDWKNMNDSTYQKIVVNRFNKGNFLIGIRLSLPDFSNDYQDLFWTFQPNIGYFIANKWMLGADYRYGLSFSKNTVMNQTEYSQYNIFCFSTRYYLKPKHRTFFGKVGLIAGNVSNVNFESSELPNFFYIYGSEGVLGFSVFIRHFELELMAGIDLYFTSFNKSKIVNNTFFQINLSYIFTNLKHK